MSESEDLTAARNEMAMREKENQEIKGLLRKLGPQAGDEEENSLTVKLTKIEGLPEAATPQFVLQLSSPIEEATLTQIYDEEAEDKTGMRATFRSVEINQATLTITGLDADVSLGTSKNYDVADLTKFDATNVQSEYTQTIRVGIAPEDMQAATESVCTIELNIVYKPSKKDQREQLYELLNLASQRRARALEKMREVTMAVKRQEILNEGSGGSTVTKKEPSIKAGFLNKKAPKKEPSAIFTWYNRHLGPNSMVRQIWPVAKNYIIFIGACTFFHFKGQLLALPPPV